MVEKENKQENNFRFAIMVVVGSIFMSLVIGLVGGKYYYDQMTTNGAELKAKKLTRTELEEKLTNLKALKPQEEALKEKSKKVLAAIPDDKDLSRLFKQLEDISQASGVTVSKVTEVNNLATGIAQNQTANADVSPIIHELTTKIADYNALKTSLAKYEDALRFLSLTQIEVDSRENSIEGKYTISTYKRNEK